MSTNWEPQDFFMKEIVDILNIPKLKIYTLKKLIIQ